MLKQNEEPAALAEAGGLEEFHRCEKQTNATPTRGALPPFKVVPHNIDAEQALLGAILINKEAQDRVSGFLEARHFFDPVHAAIYETAAKLIAAGKQATPITLRTYFEAAEPITPSLTVPQYLGRLAANATTIINAADYGRTIHDLAVRRQLIIVGEKMVAEAYDAAVDAPPAALIDEATLALGRLNAAREAPYQTRCLADVPAEPIRWLWLSRFALGKLSLIAGDPGRGKSQLTLGMAATVTRAGLWPDGTRAPSGSAIIISCEDDVADTIKPRLEAAGADMRRVHTFDWALGPDRSGAVGRRHFDVAEHVPALSELIKRVGDVRIIVVDPITAYMGRADSHKTADVRTALAPLQTTVAEFGAAGILVSHLSKSDATAMNRIVGSGAFVGVVRSAWLVADDPQDHERRRRILTPVKNNIGDDKTGWAFTIEPVHMPDGIATSRVSFDSNPVTVDANELLRPIQEAAEDSSALAEACAFLRTELADGPQPARHVEASARDAGISKATLRRAREQLCVTRKSASGWVWELRAGPAADA